MDSFVLYRSVRGEKGVKRYMLYQRSREASLGPELFQNPGKVYRGAPFWAWNGKLDKGMLERQIEYFKEMGFGGYHMHPRTGLATEYLGEEFMECVAFCVEKGKEKDMLSLLYDEDRWPSGFAGGLVTKNPKFRRRAIYITKNESALPEFETDIGKAVADGLPYVVGCYDVDFDSEGRLRAYRKIARNESARFQKYYAYSKTDAPSDRYNFQTCVDVMQPEAVREFIRLTHERYYAKVGEEYGKSVPTIFTDEPRQKPIEQMEESDSASVAVYYWTYDLDKTFREEYGYDLIEHIPALIWDTPDRDRLYVRYDYFNHATNRLAGAFFKQVSETAQKQGIAFTGHLMCENELLEQVRWTGDAMRLYPYFTVPGIDMLCDNVEFITAKQAQSVARQYGREGVLSELYGVTGWDFDFACMKMQGDWQAALGVTVRVPHLSLMSMEGRAKRDYPASFQYQAPWYKEYKYLEDHFARLNTVLTRGMARVKLAVLHPIETTMLRIGTKERSTAFLARQQEELNELVRRLLYAALDFDFISEALLPKQKVSCGNTLRVGDMEYSTVIIPPIDTVRTTTLAILKEFSENGGRVIFLGDCPAYADGRRSDAARELYEASAHASMYSRELMELLEKERDVSVSGAGQVIYQLRADGNDLWLYLAQVKHPGKHDRERKRLCVNQIAVTVNDRYNAQIYDTLTGEIRTADFSAEGGRTTICSSLYANDSLLLRLTEKAIPPFMPERKRKKKGELCFGAKAGYRRTEPNVLLLDTGRYSLDGEKYSEKQYVLCMNKHISERLGLMLSEAQPYVLKEESSHKAYLRFEFDSEIETGDVSLALERAEDCKIYLNGAESDGSITGFYTDEAIKTVKLPAIKKGANTIDIEIPFTASKNIEACYLLGDFNVILEDTAAKICAPSDSVEFGSLVGQGMPFYGGDIIYQTEAETEECTAKITVSDFGAHCVRMFVDGEDAGLIALAPFCVEKKLNAGRHRFEFVCYGNRNNTFGPVHNSRMTDSDFYVTPQDWETNNDKYFLQDTGILSSPFIEFYE